MPITIPNDLPASKVLQSENIFFMQENRASTQDIRPLHVLILNLMPDKITTETQLLRLLGNSPIQVDIELMQISSHASKNTSKEHLLRFYTTFDQVKERHFDGLIITGAPIELMPFEKVDYWAELCEIMEWSKSYVYSTFHICWGAQAALYYHYGIDKQNLPEKMFGVFSHYKNNPNHNLLGAFDDRFMVPHSRYTTIHRGDLLACPELEILSESEEAGVYIIGDRKERQFFVTGHSEYDRDNLAREYFRDKNAGKSTHLPLHYFPGDDPGQTPTLSWRAHANLLFQNWLNYFVYQATPFDLNSIQ